METERGPTSESKDAHQPGRGAWLRRGSLHSLRVAVLVVILWLIRDQHRIHEQRLALLNEDPVTVDKLREFLPTASQIGDAAGHGGRPVLDSDRKPIGYFVQTSPAADHIVGYSGPTNTLIVFDADLRIVAIDILRSGDTVEHVRDVRNDDRFRMSLAGQSWQEARTVDVDAVSGATLTSLAVLEGIAMRLGGAVPSLRFPDEITLSEVEQFFPKAAVITGLKSYPAILDVKDAHGNSLGSVFRTSPAADDEMGYQGPTDTLVAIDANGQVKAIQLRKSYDNEPYVDYIREDTYFLERFNGLSLPALSKFDPDAAAVEGVSGATMTSMAIAYGLPKAAWHALTPQQPTTRRVVWAWRDVGTCSVLGFALMMSFTRLRGVRWVRVGFQILLVAYFGFLNGDMLSQALFVGWAQSGVPWRLAPGLAMLTAAAFIVPFVSKKNLYCHQVCPFGAAQQLVRNRLPWRARLPKLPRRALSIIPAGLLLLVIITAMLHWPVNLAAIEPFDAFIFWVAGTAAITIAIGGLLVSAFVPMAYCRYGCPTGATLNYLRFHAKSEQLSRRDLAAIALLTVAVVLRFAG